MATKNLQKNEEKLRFLTHEVQRVGRGRMGGGDWGGGGGGEGEGEGREFLWEIFRNWGDAGIGRDGGRGKRGGGQL